MVNIDEKKRRAAEHSLSFVEDGMTVGLGSGTTVYWMIKKLGQLAKSGLNVRGVPTSKRTEGWAKEFGIPVVMPAAGLTIDVAIDGADEVDPSGNLIKGGGGSLVREKIIDTQAKKFIVVVDESKRVQTLGQFPLPVEVVPFGWEMTARRIETFGCRAVLRMREGSPFVSDNGNYILDCHFGAISEPDQLHQQLKLLTGVVETGLFIGVADWVLVGKESGVDAIPFPKAGNDR